MALCIESFLRISSLRLCVFAGDSFVVVIHI